MPIFKKSKKSKIIQKGKFIVIDGIDGSGKSTQLELLKSELEVNGYKVEVIHFPQHGTPSAVMVDYYLAGRYGQLNPYATSLFYAVDRFDASEKIRGWINEGKIVLSDRYVIANAGHQGGKILESHERLKFFKWLDNLEFNILAVPRPDLNIILDMPAEIAKKFLSERNNSLRQKDDMHEKDLGHLKRSREAYLEISKLFPNTKLVLCVQDKEALSVQEVNNKAWELIRRIALKDFKPQN